MKTTKRLYTAKRLYFTCPIKALYMMKEFGVKFECKYTPEEIAEYNLFAQLRQFTGRVREFYDFDEADCEGNTIEDLLENLKNFRQVYVATESEHIFEPKNGDEGFTVDSDRILADFRMGRWWWYNIERQEWTYDDEDQGKILKRDNKQFFMAEVE